MGSRGQWELAQEYRQRLLKGPLKGLEEVDPPTCVCDRYHQGTFAFSQNFVSSESSGMQDSRGKSKMMIHTPTAFVASL